MVRLDRVNARRAVSGSFTVPRCRPFAEPIDRFYDGLVGHPKSRPYRLVAAKPAKFYDPTGVRIRRVPFRDERVLEALQAAAV